MREIETEILLKRQQLQIPTKHRLSYDSAYVSARVLLNTRVRKLAKERARACVTLEPTIGSRPKGPDIKTEAYSKLTKFYNQNFNETIQISKRILLINSDLFFLLRQKSLQRPIAVNDDK